jgi:hypothetical protein
MTIADNLRIMGDALVLLNKAKKPAVADAHPDALKLLKDKSPGSD